MEFSRWLVDPFIVLTHFSTSNLAAIKAKKKINQLKTPTTTSKLDRKS
jgi:hypothetical protein